VAWLAGGIAGFAAGAPFLPPGITSASLLALGILVAADRRFDPPVVAGLAVAVGLLHGWLNGAGIATAGREGIALAGIVASVLALATLVSAAASRIVAPWARIALRVAGSWIAAIGLLLLGWTLSGRL
jgi:hydrogenase/urease accessory protein HupE